MPATYLTKQGDTLDWVCWKHYGNRAGSVEQVLDANPGLAVHGAVLPPALTVILPDLPEPSAGKVVRIWD